MLLVVLFGFGFGFAWLSVQRHEIYRTNAEDLAFTDQSIWNWLRGQAFRFSLYEQAEFKTDIDLAGLSRPDSFLAFHVEPMTALLAPLYLLWSDVRLMLVVQAVGWSLGAIPAYRLASRWLHGNLAGLAFAIVYLLSPLGQWAVLSDLHTVTLAAPLLLWMVDLLDRERSWLFLLAGLLATSTKEEVGLAVSGIGLLALWRRPMRLAGLAALVVGGAWSILCVVVIIPHYAGTAVSPFTARYAALGGGPSQIVWNLVRSPELFLSALRRPEVIGYAATLLLTGGWLGLLAPELLVPLTPSLGLNVLSSSPWMATGRAHYSAVVLPFVVLAAVVGSRRLARWSTAGLGRLATAPGSGKIIVDRKVPGAILATVALAGVTLAYRQNGAGPLAEGFVWPQPTAHQQAADRLVARIPGGARVSASSSLAPHLSQRSDLYLFPTIRQADYVALDVTATPYPISAGDVYLRAIELLGNGEWRPEMAEDGLLLLKRGAALTQDLSDDFYRFVRPVSQPAGASGPIAIFLEGSLELVAADLRSQGELGPDGPLGTLHAVWRATRPLEGQPRPRMIVQFAGGFEQEVSDFAPLWWYPPERWRPGELVELQVRGLPMRQVVGWHGEVPPSRTLFSRSLTPPVASAGQPDPDQLDVRLGELTAEINRSNWRLAVLDPTGKRLWEEWPSGPDGQRGPLGFQLGDGGWRRLTDLRQVAPTGDGARLIVGTDDPAGRQATIELSALGPRSFRLQLRLSDPEGVSAIGQAIVSPPDERLLGFGQRFTAVNQRGRVVTTWAEDRRVAGYGDTAYAPLPFFISSRGYSLALETDVRSSFDLAAERPDRYAWEAPIGELSLVFSYGPSPGDLIQQQVGRTGLPPLPPIWAFGVWKTAIGGEARVREDAARLRELGIPVSALYVYDAVDDESNVGWPYITFEGKQPGPYSDLRALTDGLHAQGYRVLTYNTADFHLNRASYAEPAAAGYFVRGSNGQPYVHPGFQLSWLDFSSPRATDWWSGLWRRSLLELGFDGGMLDLGELTPVDARYANGEDGRTMHNRYPLLYARAAFEAVRRYKPDAVLFARSGGAGAQAYQDLQWPGDPLLDWSETNGLKSLLPAALNAGLSGFPYWHPEVAGYLAAGLPPESERELWLRWLQLGAFSSLLRDAYGDHQIGTPPVEVWSDQGTLEAFRFYAQLHNSLVPYLYSYARIASETGLPLLRHLAIQWPDDGRAWLEEREYTLGNEILVAPVLDEGVRTRTLYLPAGRWVNFWTGAVIEGGRDVTVEAPLDRIPVFCRGGAILPLAANFDTLLPSDDRGVHTWQGDLVVRVMPNNGPARSNFRLYDGSDLSYVTDGRSARLRISGAPAGRGLEVHLPLASAPGRVLVDAEPAANWHYDPGQSEVIVELIMRDGEITAGP